MRLRFFGMLLFFVSAYAPLSFIFLANDLTTNPTRLRHPVPLLILSAVCSICVVVALVTMSRIRGQHTITIKSISNRSADLLNYSIPYIVSFTGLNITEVRGALTFSIFMLVLFLVTWRTQTVLLNPVLAVSGYGLFEINYMENKAEKTGIALTKLQLKRNVTYLMESVAPHLTLITKEEPTNDQGQAAEETR